ncbi:MAG: hypothetical protein QNJ17_10830 [Desulfocapsaceae bacterium]|nr:hypothetical protein [Desulfocapsaceae bacterium]
MKKLYLYLEQSYINNKALLWPNLGRLNNLLIIVNISMFFLSGLVAKGYYFTFFSLICLALVAVLLLLPLPVLERLWYYLFCLALEVIALYFLVVSIVYWVRTEVG